MIASFNYHMIILYNLTRRLVLAQYRGSALGVLWLGLLPVLMLAGYTLVFTKIFEPKWPGAIEDSGLYGYAMMLFAGLLIYGCLSEVMLGSGKIVSAYAPFIKKAQFPKIIIPTALVCSAVFNMVIGFVILMICMVLLGMGLSWSILFLPVILLPFILLLCGSAWILSAVGVYANDTNHVLAPIVTMALFLAPILYPVSAIPEGIRDYIYLNPISLISEQARACLFENQGPDFSHLGIYTAISIFILGAGYFTYSRASKGFADVL